jgi:hypothetical protein
MRCTAPVKLSGRSDKTVFVRNSVRNNRPAYRSGSGVDIIANAITADNSNSSNSEQNYYRAQQQQPQQRQHRGGEAEPKGVDVRDAMFGLSERIFEQQQNRSSPRFRSASLTVGSSNNNNRNNNTNCGGPHTILDCRLLSLNL